MFDFFKILKNEEPKKDNDDKSLTQSDLEKFKPELHPDNSFLERKDK